jgi:hypothetical protein
VIRYAYLWQEDYRRGQSEGRKDRPCAVVVATTDEAGAKRVTVLPITHSPPSDPALAVELPRDTKRRLGLDDERSWIVLTEANRLTWPGPDLRPVPPGDSGDVAYGLLPRALLKQVTAQLTAARSPRGGSVSCRARARRRLDGHPPAARQGRRGPGLLRTLRCPAASG